MATTEMKPVVANRTQDSGTAFQPDLQSWQDRQRLQEQAKAGSRRARRRLRREYHLTLWVHRGQRILGALLVLAALWAATAQAGESLFGGRLEAVRLEAQPKAKTVMPGRPCGD